MWTYEHIWTSQKNWRSRSCSGEPTFHWKIKEKNFRFDHISKLSSTYHCLVSGKMNPLVNFAHDQGLFLDRSRTAFLERQHNILQRLVGSKLKNKNRFRELLLGVKAVGKTRMLKLVQDYAIRNYEQIVSIYVSYDSYGNDLLTKVYSKLHPNFDYHPDAIDVDVAVELIEDLLRTQNVFLLFMIDEFQFVYSKNHLGKLIVSQLMQLSNSNSGRIHCIVSGSSTMLRKLAFAKLSLLDAAQRYDSYELKDLNSTKFNPHWIYPIIDANEFRTMASQMEIKPTDFALHFLCSGGRPGLMDKNDINGSCYSVGSKQYLSNDTSLEYHILSSIYDIADSIRSDVHYNHDAEDWELEILCSRLRPVTQSALENRLQAKGATTDTLLECLFNLADEGLIILSESAPIQISLTSALVSLQFLAKRSAFNAQLTWLEASALKMTQGIFHEIAEETALRFIRQNWSTVFPQYRIECTDATSLDISINRINGYAIAGAAFLNDDPGYVVNKLHRELNGNKDQNGADFILLYAPTPVPKEIYVIRGQLKLGQFEFTPDEVKQLELNMESRGKAVIDALKQSSYKVRSWSNILVTTRNCKIDDDSMRIIPAIPTELTEQAQFCVADARVCHDFWPDEVKALGAPYASDRCFGMNAILR